MAVLIGGPRATLELDNKWHWKPSRKRLAEGQLVSVTTPVIMTGMEVGRLITSLPATFETIGFTPHPHDCLDNGWAGWHNFPVYIEYARGCYCALSLSGDTGWMPIQGLPESTFKTYETYCKKSVYVCVSAAVAKYKKWQIQKLLLSTLNQIGGTE